MTAATVPPTSSPTRFAARGRRCRTAASPCAPARKTSTCPGSTGAGLYRSYARRPGRSREVARVVSRGVGDDLAVGRVRGAGVLRMESPHRRHGNPGAAVDQQRRRRRRRHHRQPVQPGQPGLLHRRQLSSGSVAGTKGDGIPERILSITRTKGATASNACRARRWRAAAWSVERHHQRAAAAPGCSALRLHRRNRHHPGHASTPRSSSGGAPAHLIVQERDCTAGQDYCL